MSLLDRGEAEVVKGAFHGAACTLVAIIGAYNVACLRKRPEPQHVINAVACLAFAMLEAYNVAEHWKR